MLVSLFQMQSDLERKYRQVEGGQGFFPGIEIEDAPLDLNLPVVNWFLKDAAQRVIEEMCEGTNVLKNKQWKQTPSQVDQEHVIEELSDFWHFAIRYTIYVLGADEDGARRLFEVYRQKHAVNQFRQRTNY